MLLSADSPYIFSVVGNGSVCAEFARIAHIEPLLLSKGKSVGAVIVYAAELCLDIAIDIAEEIVVVGSVPACAIEQGSVKLRGNRRCRRPKQFRQ